MTAADEATRLAASIAHGHVTTALDAVTAAQREELPHAERALLEDIAVKLTRAHKLIAERREKLRAAGLH